MSAPTPETLAELRRLLDEAPPLPYRDRPATHGDPSNGPTYVALEAQWEGRWEEVATGDYEKWCGMGIALAAAAVNALPALLDAAAERDALAAAVEHYTTQRQELRALLSYVAERLDAFTYDELAALISDEPLDQWGERYRAQIGAERDALAAAVERVRALHQPEVNSTSALFPTPLCGCGDAHPCATIRALDTTPDTGGES